MNSEQQITNLINQLKYAVPYLQSKYAVPSIPSDAFINGGSKTYQEIIEELKSIGPPAFDALTMNLGNEDRQLKHAVICALGEFGDSSLEPLTNALYSENDKLIRLVIIDVLGQIGEPALDVLERVLDDEDEEVRRAATKALGEIGKPALPFLTRALNDEDEEVRRAATKALGEIGEPALPFLTRALNDESYSVEMQAVQALIDIGEPAINAIRFALDSKFPAVRREVVRDLTQRLSSCHIEKSDSCIKKATIARLLAVALEDADGTLVKKIVDYLSGIEVERFFNKRDLDPKDVINAVIDELVIRSSGRPDDYFNPDVVATALKGTISRNIRLHSFVLHQLCDLAYQNENKIRDRAVAVARKLDASEFAVLVKSNVNEDTSITISIMRLLGGSEASAFFTELIYQEFLKKH